MQNPLKLKQKFIELICVIPNILKREFKFYGHYSWMHNKAINKEYNFNLIIKLLKIIRRLGFRPKVKIIVTKYNFLSLKELVKFILYLLNYKIIDIISMEFRLDSEKGLLYSFTDYINNLNMALNRQNIELFFNDYEVEEILKTVEDSISKEKWNELFVRLERIQLKEKNIGDTLRILGLLTNNVFIGPINLVLDLIHTCNIDCVHCWIHSPKAKKDLTQDFKAMIFDFSNFKKVIDDAVQLGTIGITLLADGEPLLHPNFIDMLRYTKNKDKSLRIITFSNGLTVNNRMASAMVNLGLDELYCSIPAATAKTYSRICSKGEKIFEQIKKNLLYLFSLRNRYGSSDINGIKKPFLIITFVIHRLNYHEVVDMVEFARQVHADQVRFQLIHLDKNNYHLKLLPHHTQFLKEKLNEIEKLCKKYKMDFFPGLRFQLDYLDEDSGDWSRGIYLRKGCFIGWAFSIVKANGDVSLCCAMKVIDTLNNRSFREIWESKDYNSYRLATKNLNLYRDMEFKKSIYHINREDRGDLLYSDRCEHCDNHDLNNYMIQLLENNGLYSFL